MIRATYIDHMGSDLSVVNAARVSFGKESDWLPRVHNGEAKVLNKKDTKLIFYLADHKHMSPFGHCFATFHVKAPIFVARQLVKHKFLRWNEISRRYVDDEPEFYEPDVWRGRSSDKKQGSEGVVEVLHDVKHLSDMMANLYEDLVEEGVCPEQARMVLPQSMMTEWYWSGSLDAFSDMCVLRCASDTQFETRYVAEQISLKMHELFPISWMALAKGRI
jgi:thymidylate synthase (FAD)